jgi:hypothetical protein
MTIMSWLALCSIARQQKEAQEGSEQISAQNYLNLKQIPVPVLEIHFSNRNLLFLKIICKKFGSNMEVDTDVP